jgi:pantothenate kinase
MTSFQADLEAVCALVRNRMSQHGRTVIGIAGPPASGKSKLAEAVVEKLNREGDLGNIPTAALIPMDGYHLDNVVLRARGLFDRKGAPETFDADGFCAAVHRLNNATKELFFPRFDRSLDLSIANAISIHPKTPIVIVEGNYLLFNSAPWSGLKDDFAASIFVAPTRGKLRERLLQRWIDHGLNPQAALLRASNNDLPNAERTLDESASADLVLRQESLGVNAELQSHLVRK